MSCITNADRTTTDDAKELYFVMLMSCLLKYSSNDSDTTDSFWFYSKEEATNFNNHIENSDEFKSFKSKSKPLGNTVTPAAKNQANGILKSGTFAVPLKYLHNFWRSLKMPLIYCKVKLKLRWTKHCVLSVLSAANTDDDDRQGPKLYVACLFISKR